VPTATPEFNHSKSNKPLIYAAIVIVVAVLGTTLSQFQLIGLIPLKNLLKNELHADRATTAAFFFWMQFAWYFKPFAGIITDAFPLFGTRRRSYMLVGALLTVASFVALYFTPHQYNKLLLACIAINVFMVVTSTVMGGFMVEKAQEFGAPGRLTAVRNFVQQFSYVVAGPLGGFLGAISFGWTAAAGGAIMFLVVPTTIFFLHEQRKKIDSKKLLDQAGKQLVKIANAKTMWAAAAFSGLFYFAPAFQTGLFYRQQDFLHLTTEGQGRMLFLNGIFGVLAALLYGTFFCRRLTLRKLLFVCIALGAASQFAYCFYTGLHRAYVIESFWGLGWTAADMALMDLAVRATPAGSEGLGFALMMSVRNLSIFGSDWVGSKAMEVYHLHFTTMMFIDGTISLTVLPFIFLLPAFIVDRKDAETAAAAPAPAPALASVLEE
jgi:predicted MFS family arabinose efflux permease